MASDFAALESWRHVWPLTSVRLSQAFSDPSVKGINCLEDNYR